VRSIAPLVLAGALGLSTSASASSASDGLFCYGKAAGDRGSEVLVTVVLHRGERKAFAEWTPPTNAAVSPAGFVIILKVHYPEPSEGGLGAPAAFGAFGAGKLERPSDYFLEKQLSVQITSGTGQTWSIEPGVIPMEGSKEPGKVIILGSSDADDPLQVSPADEIERLSTVRVELFSDEGTRLAAADSDLSQRADRDRMFKEAWRQAQDNAREPSRCQPAPTSKPRPD